MTIIQTVLIIATIVCFLLDAFGVSARVNWTALAWAFGWSFVAVRVAGL